MYECEHRIRTLVVMTTYSCHSPIKGKVELEISAVSLGIFEYFTAVHNVSYDICGCSVVVLCYLFWCQSFGDVSPYVRTYYC